MTTGELKLYEGGTCILTAQYNDRKHQRSIMQRWHDLVKGRENIKDYSIIIIPNESNPISIPSNDANEITIYEACC